MLIIRIDNLNYKTKILRENTLKVCERTNNKGREWSFRIRNILIDFTKLKDRELKDREAKIKREIEELFFKQIIELHL